MTKGACAAMSGNPGVHCLLGCWSTTVTSGGGWFSCKGGWSLASITAELDEKLFVVFESLLLVLITHLGTNWSFALDSVDNGGKSVAKSKWSLALVVDEASKVSSEATELAVLFIVSNDCEGLKADLRRRLYLRNDVIFKNLINVLKSDLT